MILFLLGCIEYEEGMAEQGALHCKLLDVCGELAAVGYENVDDCISDAESQSWIACERSAYDAEDMQACVDGWEAAVESKTCDANPAECASVCDR